MSVLGIVLLCAGAFVVGAIVSIVVLCRIVGSSIGPPNW